MKLQEALAASMDGPFDVGYVYEEVYSAFSGLLRVVVSSDMPDGACAISNHYNPWRRGFLSPWEDDANTWNPLEDENLIAQAMEGYNREEQQL